MSVPTSGSTCGTISISGLLFVPFLCCFVSVEAFAEARLLSASEIRNLFIGNTSFTLLDDRIVERQYLAEDGTVVFDPVRGFQIPGHWSIVEESNELCFWDATPREPFCAQIGVEDGRYYLDWGGGFEQAYFLVIEPGDKTDPTDNPGPDYRPHPRIPLPADLDVQRPGAEVPAANASLSGAWFGTEYSVRDYLIIVERIEDAHADLVFAWGPHIFRSEEPGWTRYRARIGIGALAFELKSGIKISGLLGPKDTLEITFDWGGVSGLSHAVRWDEKTLANLPRHDVLTSGSAEPDHQLMGNCDKASPHTTGFDLSAVSDLELLVQEGEYPNTHSILIEHAGCLVYEKYFAGQDKRWGDPLGHRVFNKESFHSLASISKSVTSLLVGLALEGDYAKWLDTSVTEFFDDLDVELGPGVRDITLRHALSMTAGLEWNQREIPYSNQENDAIRLFYADDPLAMVLSRPVRDPPGAKWYYNGGLTQVLAGIIERRTGRPLDVFAEEVLFEPLGITEYEWLKPPRWPAGGTTPHAAGGLRMRARDLAKIGSMVLHRGVWGGKQIVPAEWIEISTHRHVESVDGPYHGTFGYGYQWWAGRSKSLPIYTIVAALGYGGQGLFIIPEHHLVVTVFAGNYGTDHQNNGFRLLGRIAAAHKDQEDW